MILSIAELKSLETANQMQEQLCALKSEMEALVEPIAARLTREIQKAQDMAELELARNCARNLPESAQRWLVLNAITDRRDVLTAKCRNRQVARAVY